MTTPVDALDVCLRLMERARPHPDDVDRWDTTIKAAQQVANRNQPANHAAGSIVLVLVALGGGLVALSLKAVLG